MSQHVNSGCLQVEGFGKVALFFVIFKVSVKIHWLCSKNSLSFHFEWPVQEAQYSGLRTWIKFPSHQLCDFPGLQFLLVPDGIYS